MPVGPIIEAIAGRLGLVAGEAAAEVEGAGAEALETVEEPTISGPLVSSHLRAMFWDAATRNLEITFHNASIYTYPGTPREIAAGLKDAPSPGRWVRVGDEWLHAECIGLP
jgi:hypothetical protein